MHKFDGGILAMDFPEKEQNDTVRIGESNRSSSEYCRNSYRISKFSESGQSRRTSAGIPEHFEITSEFRQCRNSDFEIHTAGFPSARKARPSIDIDVLQRSTSLLHR
jgi:hypothetical protein